MNVATNNNIRCTVAMAALESVVDPEIGLNVADLGLIYGIQFDEAKNIVHCTMTLTTQFCPMGESIANAVRQSLAATFPGDEVLTEVVFDPPWNSERISEEGRQFLNR